MSDDTSLIERGLAAMERGAWEEARACLMMEVERAPSGEAYEGLSWAAWSLNEPDLLFAAREAAYRFYRRAGDVVGAARMAMWLGADYIDFRGDLSIGNGWRQRAQRLLVDIAVTPEHGWLLLLEGDAALMAVEDAPRARELAHRAIQIGRDLSVLDIEAIGLALEGVALVTEGEVSSGMLLLDEAAAASLSGEIADPGNVAWALCYLIYACERVRDYDRAVEWCERMREYADTAHMALLRGICQVRLAGVLIWRGDWDEAEHQLSDAARRLMPRGGRRAADGTVRLAELRRRQGRLAEAEQLFREVAWHPLALLGLAELALEASRPEDARDLIDRLLRQVPAGSLTQRAAAFELLVRVQALLGDHARARQALESVKTLAAAADTPPLRAAVRFSSAALAVAHQHYDEAMACLEDAVDHYERCGAPYEAAWARLELARVLVQLGRLERARFEADLAGKALQRLNSEVYAGRAAALQRDIRHRLREALASADGQGPLTARQLDVLRLIARGLSNREIADALFVSEHTVHRHVANILQRLDLPSRAAAAAYATGHDLI